MLFVKAACFFSHWIFFLPSCTDPISLTEGRILRRKRKRDAGGPSRSLSCKTSFSSCNYWCLGSIKPCVSIYGDFYTARSTKEEKQPYPYINQTRSCQIVWTQFLRDSMAERCFLFFLKESVNNTPFIPMVPRHLDFTMGSILKI